MSPMIRRAVVAITTSVVAVSLLGAASTPGFARTASGRPAARNAAAQPSSAFPFDYWVDATTTLKKLNQTVTVPRGEFKGSIDFSTTKLTGTITLPPAKAPFKVAGLPLATATFKITEVEPVTGNLDLNTLVVTATSVFNIQIVSVSPIGLPSVNLVGNSCVTSKPVSVTMSGPFSSGRFSGTYTIPPLKNCGASTTVLNQVVPGPGNTFTAVVTPK
jgi:hypothetical protein